MKTALLRLFSNSSHLPYPKALHLTLRSLSTPPTYPHHDEVLWLSRDSNQALGLAQYALDFIQQRKGQPLSKTVLDKIKYFHLDAVICAYSALSLKANAPTILRQEALDSPQSKGGACVFGSDKRVAPEKAIVANCSATREWDSNGTNFGYNPNVKDHQAGEFGHNDFYPVVIAAAQASGAVDGAKALRAMVCLDEIRGRLAEVFSLKSYKIDHVLYGAIASAAVYGALMGATAEQIESAIGMTVAHYVPWRAIRAGRQLSDSKGASAAISTEAAVLSMRRAMNGFQGPKDIFRNPESVFCWNEKQKDIHSPFNLVMTHSGDQFALCGMHLKLGIYEHQSAGAIEAILRLVTQNPQICNKEDQIKAVIIKAYEPAFGIIGDVAKRNPTTRQSADHSMVYIISSILRKAMTASEIPSTLDEAWCKFMLTPYDYQKESINNQKIRDLIGKIEFVHGGPEYDKLYPDGIPTSVTVTMNDGKTYDSGLVMYPAGHARNTSSDLDYILKSKFKTFSSIAFDNGEAKSLIDDLLNIENASSLDLQQIYNRKITYHDKSIDA